MNHKHQHTPFKFEIEALSELFNSSIWSSFGIWIIIDLVIAALIVMLLHWLGVL
ncbi:MAG: hypothetical protein OXH98_14455 [Caldilineaceae bacterium]|nr:hypothetical protein [Caldilineaceae bacterium]